MNLTSITLIIWAILVIGVRLIKHDDVFLFSFKDVFKRLLTR